MFYLQWCNLCVTRIYYISFQGITIKPLVRLIKVKTAVESKPSLNEVIHGTVSWYYKL